MASNIEVVSQKNASVSKDGKKAQLITRNGTKHTRLVKPGVYACKNRKQYKIGE